MEDSRIVITGLGAVTPVGLDQPSTWAALIAGRSGLAPLAAFDAPALGFDVRVAAEVKGFDPSVAVDRRAARRMDRVMQFGLVAAREALADAGLLAGDGPASSLAGGQVAQRCLPEREKARRRPGGDGG